MHDSAPEEQQVAEWAAAKEWDARMGRAGLRADRREAIATQLLARYIAGGVAPWEIHGPSINGLMDLADKLIGGLDARRARDEQEAYALESGISRELVRGRRSCLPPS